MYTQLNLETARVVDDVIYRPTIFNENECCKLILLKRRTPGALRGRHGLQYSITYRGICAVQNRNYIIIKTNTCNEFGSCCVLCGSIIWESAIQIIMFSSSVSCSSFLSPAIVMSLLHASFHRRFGLPLLSDIYVGLPNTLLNMCLSYVRMTVPYHSICVDVILLETCTTFVAHQISISNNIFLLSPDTPTSAS